MSFFMIPGSGSGDQTVNTRYTADTSDQEKKITNLGKKTDDATKKMTLGLTSFRDGLFRVFRVLARVRTAFFILVTFLGLRQIGRFVKTLSTFSTTFANKMGEIGQRFEYLKLQLGGVFETVISQFVEKITTDIEEIFHFLGREGNSGWTIWIGYAKSFGNIVRGVVHGLIGVIAGFMTVWHAIKPFITFIPMLFESAIQGVGLVVYGVLNGFKSMQLAMVDFLNMLPSWMLKGPKLDRSTLEKAWSYSPQVGKSPAELSRMTRKQRREYANSGVQYKPSSGGYLGAMMHWGKKQIDKGDLMLEWAEGAEDSWMRMWDQGHLAGKMLGKAFMIGWGEENVADEWSEDWTRRVADPETMQGMIDGFKQGVIQQRQSLRQLGVTMGEAIAKGVESGISDAWVNIMAGRFSALRDIAKSTLEAINKAIADFIAKLIMQRTLSPLWNWLLGSMGMTQSAYSFQSSWPAGANVQTIPGPNNPDGRMFTPDTGALFHLGNAPILRHVGQGQGQGGGAGGVTIVMAPQVIDGPSFSGWLAKERDTIANIMVEAVKGKSAQVREAFRAR